jgi:hypothetical protein
MQGSRNNTGTSAIRDAYIVESVGPSRTDDIHTGFWGNDRFQPTGETVYFVPYDPSNGTVSRGDVYRVGGRVPKWFIERGWPLVNPAK